MNSTIKEIIKQVAENDNIKNDFYVYSFELPLVLKDDVDDIRDYIKKDFIKIHKINDDDYEELKPDIYNMIHNNKNNKLKIICSDRNILSELVNLFESVEIYGTPENFRSEKLILKEDGEGGGCDGGSDGSSAAEGFSVGMTTADIATYDSPFTCEIPTKFSKKLKKLFRRGDFRGFKN